MIFFSRKPDTRVKIACAGSTLRLCFMSSFILLSFNILQGQSIVRLNVLQPPVLHIKMPTNINTADDSPIQLGDSIIVNGGTSPYRYTWKSGSQILSESSSMEVIPGNITSRYNIKITDSNDCTVSGEVSVIVGIEEKDLLPVKVYPVPATSFIIIEPGDGFENATLTLYSISGVRLLSETLKGRTTIPLDVKAGIYVLEIKHKNRLSIRKIIVSGK